MLTHPMRFKLSYVTTQCHHNIGNLCKLRSYYVGHEKASQEIGFMLFVSEDGMLWTSNFCSAYSVGDNMTTIKHICGLAFNKRNACTLV